MRCHSRLHARGYGAKGDHWAEKQQELSDMDCLERDEQLVGGASCRGRLGGNLPNKNKDDHSEAFICL